VANKKKLEAAYESALRQAALAEGPDISMGAVRLRSGVGSKHERQIGAAHVVVTYIGPSLEPPVRPLYKVVIKIGKLRHKLTVGGAANWYKQNALPASPEAIDAAAGGAIRFASVADEDTPQEIADVVNEATLAAMKDDGSYAVERKDRS